MSGLIEGSWFLISVPVMLTITWSQTLKTPLCPCERMKMKKAKEKAPQTKPLLSWKWLAEPPKQSWGAPGHTWRITNPCGLTLPCFSGPLYTLSCLLNTPPSTSAASNFKKKTAVRRKLHQGPTPAPPPPTPLRPHSTCSPGPRPGGLVSRCPHLSGPRTLLPWKKCINVLHT